MTLAPEGRPLLRIEARNAAVPIERKPEWIKTRAIMGPEYTALRSLVSKEGPFARFRLHQRYSRDPCSEK